MRWHILIVKMLPKTPTMVFAVKPKLYFLLKMVIECAPKIPNTIFNSAKDVSVILEVSNVHNPYRQFFLHLIFLNDKINNNQN